jgi:hypothetical protein
LPIFVKFSNFFRIIAIALISFIISIILVIFLVSLDINFIFMMGHNSFGSYRKPVLYSPGSYYIIRVFISGTKSNGSGL